MSADRTDIAKELTALLEGEMRIARTPSDLLAWIDAIHDKLGATEEGRKQLRVQKGPIKLLFEEVRPLALFGLWLAREYPNLTVQPLAGKELAYDGILRSPKWVTEQKVEIGFAIDGHQEHLRMLHLNDFGRAPAVGEIIYERAKGKTLVKETPLVAHAAHEIRANAYELVRVTAEKKLIKSYSQDTWLLIVFDDNVGFSAGGSSREDASAEFRAFLTKTILSMPWGVDAVFVMGSSGRLVGGGRLDQR